MILFGRCIVMLALAACIGMTGCAAQQASPDSWAGVLDGDVDWLTPWRQVLGDQSAAQLNADRGRRASVATAPRAGDRRQAVASRASADGVVLAMAEEPVTTQPRSFDLGPLPPATACHDGCCGHAPACATGPCPLATACGSCAGCFAGGDCKLLTRPDPGPPPMRYYPPMPPKFLPVPTQPVLSPARRDAPYAWRGDMEMGFRPQVTFPARD